MGHAETAFGPRNACAHRGSIGSLSANGPVERLAAQHCLVDVPLKAFLDDVMQVDGDDVTALIMTQHDPAAFAPVSSLTVGAFRNWLLDPATTGNRLCAQSHGA